MKNIISVFLFSFISVALYAATNNLTMVTYFPTPYMVYQDLDVEQSCSLGLISQCNLKTNKLTVTDTLTLKQGKLDLQGGNMSVNQQFIFGDTTASTNGRIIFQKDLEIGDTAQTLENITTTGLATLDSGLQLGSYSFPSCNGGGSISWEELTIEDIKGEFLVCGPAVEAYKTCSAKSYNAASIQTLEGNTMYSGLYDMGGSCNVNSVVTTLQSKTGVSRRCDFMGEEVASLSYLQNQYLSCEKEADWMWSDSSDYASFSCIFVNELSNSPADNYGHLTCVAGVMSCEVKTDTWTCLQTQTCGNQKDSCL